ncbi:MAG: hypothetical protein E7319_01130 [Clostridiales bacterium]|nr:hypothetical protein [Clostridiales bacterium]
MRRLSILILVLCLLCSCALGEETISGVRYKDYLTRYAENIDLINNSAGRHLLPLVPATRSSAERDGRKYHEIFGDVLSLTIRTDPTGEIIELCTITITAPADMAYGSATHRDFTTSGYQSYAMLMAMDTASHAHERYQLVEDVEAGLANGNGTYLRQLGVYRLTCTSENRTVTMQFHNTLVEPTPTPAPEETPVTEAEATPEPDSES